MTDHSKPRLKKKRGVRLSPFAKKAIKRLRGLPRSQAAFTLRIMDEGTPHVYEALGNGGPASTYYICLSASGKMPDKLPPTSTYMAKTPGEVDTILAYFADNPDLWSAPRGEPLEGDWEPYTEAFAEYRE